MYGVEKQEKKSKTRLIYSQLNRFVSLVNDLKVMAKLKEKQEYVQK